MADLSDKERAAFPGRDGGSQLVNDKKHQLCAKRLHRAVEKSSYVKYMLDAMKSLGCEVQLNKHLVCEPCSGQVLGGFDPRTKQVRWNQIKKCSMQCSFTQIVLCENSIYSQGCMNDTLTHELIHAYDYCRAELDWNNLDHLACTEIRAANLSGDCFFWKETFARLKFGWKKHQQVCVKERAIKSISCVQDVTHEEARRAVERVFDNCFRDTVPFERVPP